MLTSLLLKTENKYEKERGAPARNIKNLSTENTQVVIEIRNKREEVFALKKALKN